MLLLKKAKVCSCIAHLIDVQLGQMFPMKRKKRTMPRLIWTSNFPSVCQVAHAALLSLEKELRIANANLQIVRVLRELCGKHDQ